MCIIKLLFRSLGDEAIAANQNPSAAHAKPVAIVVGVQLSGDESTKINDDLRELESLLATLGIEARARVIQKRARLVARSLLGSGKIDEIKVLAGELDAQLVVFDRELTGVQQRNLEKLIGLEILDRTGVILEIFSEHARTNQAKTQVEIARLEYLLPRLSGAWTHFQRQKGGGVRARGMGEKQIEVDRRRARERIARLQKQLEQIRKEKRTQRKGRESELKVAFVGYTNSGKTTLMNSLTKAQLKAKDELFATLDTSVKVIDPRTRPKILLSDTVGFIRNLPHSLVESFKSTLDEVVEADLLLHVVDASHERFKEQMATTEKVLGEIGAAHLPIIVVFNKTDQIDDPYFDKILTQAYRGSICVSALNADDALRLREHIYEFFADNMLRVHLKVDPANQETMSQIYNNCLVLETDYNDPSVVDVFVQAPRSTIAKLSRYVASEDRPLLGEEGLEPPNY